MCLLEREKCEAIVFNNYAIILFQIIDLIGFYLILKLILDNEVVTEKKFQPFEDTEEIRSIDLLVCRKKSLEQKKFRIGILCSGLTENPEEKVCYYYSII